MTYDHRASSIHRAELDREIDAIRNERLISAAADRPARAGFAGRTRRSVGRILIAAGMALVGREPVALRTHRA